MSGKILTSVVPLGVKIISEIWVEVTADFDFVQMTTSRRGEKQQESFLKRCHKFLVNDKNGQELLFS